MDVNKILQTKSINDMSSIEMQMVLKTAREAYFERTTKMMKTNVDVRKRAVGEWALNLYKNESTDIILKNKIKTKHIDQINYFLKNKEIPEIVDERLLNISSLIKDIEYEIICRKIVKLTLDN